MSISPIKTSSDPAVASSSAAPHIALVFVQVMFGTFPIAGKIALRELPSTGVVMFRITGAALAFWCLRGIIRKRDHEVIHNRKDYLRLALLSVLGVVLNQFMFVKGLELSTVINATLLGVAIPVWTLIVSFVLGRERLSLRTTLGILLAMSGVVYLIDPARAEFSSATTLGNVLLIANTAAYGAYIALSQNMVRRYGALTVISWLFLFACVAAIPFGGYHLARVSLAEVSGAGWLAILYIILVPTVAAYYLNAWALARVSPSIVAAYIYLQPLIAFALAPLIFGEQINSRTWVAAALVCAGVAVTTIKRGNKIDEETRIAEYHLSASGR